MKRKLSPTRIPKPRKKRSWVWNYFTESTDENEIGKIALCKVEDCKDPKIVLKFNNTTQLSQHLELYHNLAKDLDPEAMEDSSVVSSEKNEANVGFTIEKQDAIDGRLYVLFCRLLQKLLMFKEWNLLHQVTPQ